MKKSFSVILILCMLISIFAIPCAAQTADNSDDAEPNPAKFTYISSAVTSIGLDNGVVTVAGTLNCKTNVSSCSVTIFIQRRPIGSTAWSNIASFSASGVRHCAAGGSKDALHGYEYRARAKYTANGSDGGSETTYGYSVIAQYP